MAYETDEQGLSAEETVLREAKDRFKRAAEWEEENRSLYVDDVKFALEGEQWPEGVKRERERRGRPCLTFNRLAAFIGKAVNDARQNSPAIKVHPVDDQSDPEVAKIYEGLIRHIEYASNADQAYDTALECAAAGGMGAFRILTEYSDEDTFELDIRIKRITNPLTVYWDPDAKEYDKSDAQWCFVSELISEKAFKKRYPKAAVTEWSGDGIGEDGHYWIEDDKLRIAEYWCKKPVTKTIGLLETGESINLDKAQAQEFEGQKYIVSQGQPVAVVRERQVETTKVVRYLLSGDAVLEGPSDWAGKYIPIIPVFGPEVHIEGKTNYRSIHRFAKESQQQYNYWQTAITEKIALAPKAPFIMSIGQVEGLEDVWGDANNDNQAYLPYNPDPQAPPPQRSQPAHVNAAEIQQTQQSVEEMKAIMNIYDASLGNESSERSGRAILARQRQGDMATFAWVDNLGRSIRQAGRVLVDLIPKIYDTERVVRILGEDEKDEFVPINVQVMHPSGEPVLINDLSLGKYDVAISSGPSYQTQRLEAANSLMEFARAVPDSAGLVMDLIAKNMDWPGAEEIAERLKTMLPPQITMLDASEEERAQMEQQAQQPSPEQQMEMQKAQIEQMKAQMEAMEAQADVAKTEEETESQRLDNMQKAMELSMQNGELQSFMEEMVRQQVNQIMQGFPSQ